MWNDHFSIDEAWTKMDDLADDNAVTIVSGGWLVRETDEQYVIARDLDVDCKSCGGVMVILKAAVIKKWNLGDLTLNN